MTGRPTKITFGEMREMGVRAHDAPDRRNNPRFRRNPCCGDTLALRLIFRKGHDNEKDIGCSRDRCGGQRCRNYCTCAS
jgi:hypothetical protein